MFQSDLLKLQQFHYNFVPCQGLYLTLNHSMQVLPLLWTVVLKVCMQSVSDNAASDCIARKIVMICQI